MQHFTKEFIELLAKKDSFAFNQFYLETTDRFFRHLKYQYRMPEQDAMDVLSDLYVKCRNTFDRYDSSYSFESFVWMIFRNVINDFLKKKKDSFFSDLNRTNSAEDENIAFEDTIESVEASSLDLLEKDYQYDRIQQSLSHLPVSYREVLFLKFAEGHSNSEIATITGDSEDNVRKKLSRGIKRLKEQLENT
ncbi:MAG TPA: sigma-70 family RNA polymerase sigma factor [Candidatus Absconditabacterales bacterium]|nr:sigma-70 family RNA polymerase sigma factor [Candidatus Absconditabacterales bacterium]